MKVLSGHWSDALLAEGNCTNVSECKEKVGEQDLDWIDKNLGKWRKTREAYDSVTLDTQSIPHGYPHQVLHFNSFRDTYKFVSFVEKMRP